MSQPRLVIVVTTYPAGLLLSRLTTTNLQEVLLAGPPDPVMKQEFEVERHVGVILFRDQWIQVDFGSPRRVTGVLLQGGSLNAGDKQWVKSFKVLFRDGEFEESDSTPVINGTFDRDTVVRRYLDPPITARFFRIKPVTWSGYITLRFDLLGCDV
ncbi:EGF-like repeat and discoidin I-like domain-containing protein 3 [Holothuria leucospilota]|uniref:EGF-like repeat and discoidin I-like domain-containing protein 3 n=1 Tax=Holothuria leucospilota TaxID=206669 RepID=A0A9Q1CD18_HOLLE|nr:EGF-like repeat and discoidin I-like domain-containing protein 3 [Holothuria leucospilota]